MMQHKLDPGGIAAGGGVTIGTVTAMGYLNENAQALGVILTAILVSCSVIYWWASYRQKERAMKLSRDAIYSELRGKIEQTHCPSDLKGELLDSLNRRLSSGDR